MKTLTKTITMVQKYQLYEAGEYRVLKAENDIAVSGKSVPSSKYWIIPADRCNTDNPGALIKRALVSGPSDHLIPLQVVSEEYMTAYKNACGTGDAEWPNAADAAAYLASRGPHERMVASQDQERMVAPLDWFDGFIYDKDRKPIRRAIHFSYIDSSFFVDPNKANGKDVFATPEKLVARLKQLPSIVKGLRMCDIPLYNRDAFEEGVDFYVHLSAKGWDEYIKLYRKKGSFESSFTVGKLVLAGKLR